MTKTNYKGYHILPLLHQPLHLSHLALKEAVDTDLAAVGVEGDGGEASKRVVSYQPLFSFRKVSVPFFSNLFVLAEYC